MSIEEFESEILAGVISENGLQRLQDAEVYGTATPMQWLGERLKILRSLVAAGSPIEIQNKMGKQLLTSEAQFFDWCKQALPDAFASFFE